MQSGRLCIAQQEGGQQARVEILCPQGGYEDASIQGSAKMKAAGKAGHRRTGTWYSAWPSTSYERSAHSTEGDAGKEDGSIVKDTSAAETGPRQASGSW